MCSNAFGLMVTFQGTMAQTVTPDGTLSNTPVEKVCIADSEAPRKFPPKAYVVTNLVEIAKPNDAGLSALDKTKIPPRRKYVYVPCPPIAG